MYKETKSSWEQYWELYRKMEKKNFRNLYREYAFDAWCRDVRRYLNELIGFDLDVQNVEVKTQRENLCENKEYQFLKRKKDACGLIVHRLIKEGINAMLEFHPVEGSRVTKEFIDDTVNHMIGSAMR